MKKVFGSSYFTYSFKERKSLFYLSALLAFLVFAYIYLQFYPPRGPSFEFISSLDTFAKASYDIKRTGHLESSQSTPQTEISFFDPNQITNAQLLALGVSKKAALNWSKYVQKGGKFKTAVDLKKIYGLSESTYDRIKPFLLFNTAQNNKFITQNSLTPTEPAKAKIIDPNTAVLQDLIDAGIPARSAQNIIKYRSNGGQFKSAIDLVKIYGMSDSLLKELKDLLIYNPSPKADNATLTSIDINTSDTSGWKKLAGIGSVLSKRIVNYREKLGGFYSPLQLKEVYGLADSTLQKIQPLLQPSSIFRKIRINQDTLTRLYHPYISKKDAQVIEQYKNQHGPFNGPDDLKSILAFDQNFWDRLIPYFDFTLPSK